MKNRFIFISLLGIFFYSCSSETEYFDLSSYYYPFESLESGLIYEYEQIGNDTIDTEYLLFKSSNKGGKWSLTGTYYDNAFNRRQFYKHSIHENGTLVEDYQLFLMDSLGEIDRISAEIRNPNGFPFQLKDSMAVLITEMSWLFNESPKHQTTIVRNRQYKGREQFKFKGDYKEAISFNMKELVDDETIGHLETTYNGIELYAKGIGLVYYHKEIGGAIDMQYQLKDIYPVSQMEALFKGTHEE